MWIRPRVAEISLKNHQNAKNSPLTPIVTKMSFPHFSARRGPLTPKRGEDTSGTRVRSHANFGVNQPAGCREIVDRTKKHTVKQIPRPPFAHERMAGNKCVSKTQTRYTGCTPRGGEYRRGRGGGYCPVTYIFRRLSSS